MCVSKVVKKEKSARSKSKEKYKQERLMVSKLKNIKNEKYLSKTNKLLSTECSV